MPAPVPGPVCYDAGGEQVTVTDADLALGIIDPNYFLGGRKNLNKEKSLKAIEEKIARPLKLKVHEAAAGIYDIVNAKMSDLIRRQVVRTGYLPEEFVIYAFGGAGPVHAAGFAAELGIKQIYIFATSPVFSAFGAAAADVIRTRVMSCQYILPADPAVVNQRLDAIESEMKTAMTGEGFKPNQVEFRRFFTMRYRRQTAGVEMPVSWDRFNAKRMTEMQSAFEKKYEELYGVGAGYTKAGIEISEIRVDAVGKVAKPRLSASRKRKSDLKAARKGKRRGIFHPARPKIHRHAGVRLRAARRRRGGERPGRDRAAFYHDLGAARPQGHGGSVYEFGDASAVSEKMEYWNIGIME